MSINLSTTAIVAYLGAAAWFPQILNWVYIYFTKPVLTITPAKFVSIGHTTFGPIFNLRLSINVDKKDTLIDFIGIELCHQSGSKHNFEWMGMTEFFSEVKNNKGENQVVQRDIVPISIKLSTLSLVERFFRFQDSIFIQSNKIELDKATETQQYMKKNKLDYYDEFLKSKEFHDYLKFTRTSFYWQAGTYTVTFYVRSPEKIKFKKTIFKLELTQNNVDMLINNLNEIKTDIEFLIKKPDLPDFSGQQGNWAWCNVNLNKTS